MQLFQIPNMFINIQFLEITQENSEAIKKIFHHLRPDNMVNKKSWLSWGTQSAENVQNVFLFK